MNGGNIAVGSTIPTYVEVAAGSTIQVNYGTAPTWVWRRA